MNFYTAQHEYYCGIDLRAKSLYVCILDGRLKYKSHRAGAAELFRDPAGRKSVEIDLDTIAHYDSML